MYERPEIFEIGQAAELTLGFTSRTVTDGCDCTKYAIIFDLPEAESEA